MTFSNASTPASIAATSTGTTASLTKMAATLTCVATAALLIIRSHSTHILAYVLCVTVWIVELRRGMQEVGDQAGQKLCGRVTMPAEMLENVAD
jgi:hypothetical protein